MEIELGFWAEVIYGSGEYPAALKEKLKSLGITLGTLPSAEENKGSSDFFGLNHYTTRVVRSCSDECGDSSDLGFQLVECPNWPGAGSTWLKKVPWGIRKLLEHIHAHWDSNKYPIMITENGVSSAGNGTDAKPELVDEWRVNFYKDYIGQVHRAMEGNGINFHHKFTKNRHFHL